MVAHTHGAVAVQHQRLDQLFTVRFRCDGQGGESQQNYNLLCSHGPDSRRPGSNTNLRDPTAS